MLWAKWWLWEVCLPNDVAVLVKSIDGGGAAYVNFAVKRCKVRLYAGYVGFPQHV